MRRCRELLPTPYSQVGSSELHEFLTGFSFELNKGFLEFPWGEMWHENGHFGLDHILPHNWGQEKIFEKLFNEFK
jgi:hypothetical protein